MESLGKINKDVKVYDCRKILQRGIATVLAVIFVASTVVTAFAEDVQVFMQDDRPIDIILAAGKTSYDLERFEPEILQALQAAGVDLNRVQLYTMESNSSETSDDFEWEKTGRERKVYIGTDEGVETPHFLSEETGYKIYKNQIMLDGDPSDGYTCGVKYSFPEEVVDLVREFKLSFTLDPRCLYTHPTCNAVFKVGDVEVTIDSSLVVRAIIPNGDSVYLGTREKMDLRMEVSRDSVKLFKNEELKYEGQIPETRLDKMTADVKYGSHNCSVWAYFLLSNFVVETQVAKDLIDVVRAPDWRPNSHRFVVDVNDFVREDLDVNGSLGECIQRLCADDGYYINYGQPGSQAQANAFIAKLGYSSMSSDGKRGMYSSNTGNMTSMTRWIEYIVNKVKSGDGDVVLERDIPFQYNINPRTLAANTANAAFPDGRWHTKYTTKYAAPKDPNFTFEGQLEPPFWTNRYRQDFSFSTAQVGVYELTFADNPAKPSRIIVHQLPVAKFSTFDVVKGAGNWYDITFKTNSYDPDAPTHVNPANNKRDNGIVEHIFEYRPAGINGTPQWTRAGGAVTTNADGSINCALQIGNPAVATEWELRYTVVDYQGATSLPVIKYIQGKKQQYDTKPIAAFEFPNSKYSTYEWSAATNAVSSGSKQIYNVIQDSSYDPMGYPLVKYRWQWLAVDNTLLGGEIIASPENKTQMIQVMNAAPSVPGTYYLQLIVERGSGGTGEELISESYKRVIEFTREAYSMWFSELASWTVIKNENAGKSFSPPPVTMQGISSAEYPLGYNRMTGFATATIPSNASAADKAKYARRTTFNQLRTGTSSRITKDVYIEDGGVRGAERLNLTEYSVELTSEFLWPVTRQQIDAGEAMLALWGTPIDDWALVPDGKQPVTLLPRYISNTTSHATGGGIYQYFYIKDPVKWDSHLNEYSLVSVTRGESYRFAAKTPGHSNKPYYVYSSTLKRRVFDWETGTYTDYDGIYEFPVSPGASMTIKVPSRMSSIKIQGEGGYARDGVHNTAESVAAVYFRDTRTENASAGGKLGYKARDNTTEEITVSGLEKGQTKTMYFYVSPETSLITGEVYKDQGLSTTHTYKDDIYATSITPVNIYRLKDDARLRLDGAVLAATRTEKTLLSNTKPDGSQKPISLNLSMVDSSAIIRGIRINGANTWTKYNNKNSVVYNFTPTQAVNTIDILVSPEDREIQQLYTIVINVPDTFQATSAVVSYKTTDKGTFTGTLSGNVFTVTVPENVRMGKLCVQAVNQHSVVNRLAQEEYNANAVEIDWELPYHNNPNATFVIKPIAGSTKTYSIKFVKVSTKPVVTVTNNTVLDAIYSPQGRYLNNTYTAYENIADAAPAFSGNGVPVEVQITNRETVQGVTAEMVFNGEKFPVHWDTYDGPTYRDGQEVMSGYAVISKTALKGLNGPQPITCNVYTYDYEGSEPVDIAMNVAVRNIIVDSTGPNFSVSASLNPSMIRFTGISDNMVPVGILTLEWATSDGSGYDNSYSLDTENHPDIQVRVDGVSEELKCKFVLADVLGNTTEVENKLDFSAAAGIDVHMEFGRNADGFFVNVRKNDNESIGYDRFEFLN